MKKIILILISAILLNTQVYANTKEPQVAAMGAVLMDAETGRVLYGKNETKPLAMASTTKIMTAILVLEKGNMEDVVTISKRASSAPEVNMNLREGQKFSVNDLLFAMMLKSYNDTAVALSEHISGSVENFCIEMTEKAKEIGAKDTVFGTPNGLDSHLTLEEHHSTAKDMAIITKYALKNPEFIKLINTSNIEISKPSTHLVANQNRFLKMYDGAIGVKTGFTNKAGQCFVGAAKKDDVTLITTVLASGWGGAGKEQKWKDTIAMMDYGFDNYTKKTIVKSKTIAGNVSVQRSPTPNIEAVFDEEFSMLLNEDELNKIKVTISLDDSIEAPVQIGDYLGHANVVLDGISLKEIPLISLQSARKFTLIERLKLLSKEWLSLERADS